MEQPLRMSDGQLEALTPEPTALVEILPPMHCAQCDKDLPQTAEYWHLNKENRVNLGKMCRLCSIEAGATGGKPAKQRALRAATQELLKHARANRLACPHVAEIAIGMVQKFGGVEGLCNEWFEQIQLAKDGSKGRLDQYMVVAKLIQASSEEADRQVNTLTDAELQAEVVLLLDKMLPHVVEMRDDDELAIADEAGTGPL